MVIQDKGKNWQNGQNKGQGFNGSNVQCSYCKRQRHTVANCILLREELKRRGFKISKGNGFGSNGGKFRPGQGKQKVVSMVEINFKIGEDKIN